MLKLIMNDWRSRVQQRLRVSWWCRPVQPPPLDEHAVCSSDVRSGATTRWKIDRLDFTSRETSCSIVWRVEFTELSTNINKIIWLLNISGGISAKHHKAEERGRFKQLMFCLVTPAKLRPPGLCPMSTFQEVSAVFQRRAPVCWSYCFPECVSRG